MGKRQVTVAAVQMQCTNHPQENLKKQKNGTSGSRLGFTGLFCSPELFEREYFCQQRRYDFYSYAKSVEENEAVCWGQKLAKELKVVLPISFYEKEVNNLYNSVACIDADGEILGVYRKTHIPDDHYYQENSILHRETPVSGYLTPDMERSVWESAGISGSRRLHGVWL